MSSATTYKILSNLLLLASAYLGFSQQLRTRDDIIDLIDSTMMVAIQQEAFPGAVLYVAINDSIVLHKAYGHHTYDSTRAMSTGDIFDLASITKVTAGGLALMKLYDEGYIDLDAPIKKYVSGLNWNKRGNATIRQSLAHTAGWKSWIPYHQDLHKSDGTFNPKYIRTSYSETFPFALTDSLYLKKDFYTYIKSQIRKSDFNPDQGYVYSDLFQYMVPEIVQNLTGQTIEEYLDENFYVPLDAVTLGFNPLARFADSVIVPTEIDTFFRMEAIHGKVHDEGAILMQGISGNAGLFGNALDLAKVWQLFLRQGYLDTVSLIQPQTIHLFTTVQYPNEGNRRGLVFDKPLLKYDSIASSVAQSVSNRSYGHSGFTGPIVWADPENELLFIFLCNRVYPSRSQRKIYDLNVRPNVHQLIYDWYNSQKIKKG